MFFLVAEVLREVVLVDGVETASAAAAAMSAVRRVGVFMVLSVFCG